jgi:hypothetical protein
MSKLAMWILWPSFLAAGIGVGLVFSLLDPDELVVLGQQVHAARTAVYTLGFFILWAIAACASAMSCFLALYKSGTRDPKGG